jgi:glutamate racemase
MQLQKKGPIGVFDSGYGGLTILSEIRHLLPQYDYIYLGDNARAPYGVRSFEIVYKFTLEAVEYLFNRGCNLVILACNTASAKALRTIQQNDLPRFKDPTKRVLGIIRPTVENIGLRTRNGKIGIFGTAGTIQSRSYDIEVEKMYPGFQIYGHACPMWVPLVENKEASGDGADYFVKKDIDNLMKECNDIDTVILGCTHYPLLEDKIKKYMPGNVNIVTQGEIIANSLKDYLIRHPEIDDRCSKNKKCIYLTTESEEKFKEMASVFLNEDINPIQIDFGNC